MDKKPSFLKDEKTLQRIKTGMLVVGFFAVTVGGVAFFGNGTGGGLFQASLLGSGTPKPFDGTVPPALKTANWVKLSSSEYTNFKNGSFTYEQASAAGKLIDIPKYDAEVLKNDPAKLGWKGADLDIRNTLLTYVTAYGGAYTSGSAPALELVGSHPAVDIRAPKGTPIFAIANGKVTKMKNDKSDGGVVVIEHPDVPSLSNPSEKTTYYSNYLHMDTILIKEGQVVSKGEQIGTVGNTGIATTYHLHFQIDKKDAPFHPFWPFTFTEAKNAGLDFVSGVDQGLGKEKAELYTIHPFKWIDANASSAVSPASTSSSGSTTIPAATTSTPTATVGVSGPTLSKLQLSSSDTSITAGNTATLTVTALDGSEKVMEAFTTPVTITASQGAKGTLSQSTLSNFTKGMASFTYKTNEIETVTLTVASGSITSSITLSVTDRIKNPTKFSVNYPAEGTVGGVVNVSIQAIDELGQPTLAGLTDAILVGAEGGEGNFSKTILGFSDFKDGVATVTFTPSVAGTYAITVKAGNITGTGPVLQVKSSETPIASTNGFSDVDVSTPHGKAILYLKSKGIIEGYSDGTFRPMNPINRAEGTKVILASLGSKPSDAVEKTSFVDTAPTDWFTGWVEYGKNLGVLAGNPDGTFTPGRQVNLAEAIKIILLANKVDLSNETVFDKPYADVEKDAWFAVYFQYAKNKNLLDADSEGKINAGNALTRGEVAEIMYRLVRIQETGAESYSPAIDG